MASPCADMFSPFQGCGQAKAQYKAAALKEALKGP